MRQISFVSSLQLTETEA